jgi:hypothetical protein
LHSFMYGLHYPAVLGTGIVVALLRIASHTMHAPAASVALIVWAFFCLSFMSAIGFEEEYGWGAFFFDMIELLGMFACLLCLRLLDPTTSEAPLVRLAYLILLGVVALQVGWRWAMGLKPHALVDLKLGFLGLLIWGVVLGNCNPGLHWVIAIAFCLLAVLYVISAPYKVDKPARTFFLWPKSDSNELHG